MSESETLSAFINLGNFLRNHINGEKITGMETFHDELNKIIETNFQYNGWFTIESMKKAVKGISFLLEKDELLSFSKGLNGKNVKTVAVIMAGNIPAVGFHDLLCVLLSGNKILIKVSSDDQFLIPFFAKVLIHYYPDLSEKIQFAEGKLTKFDAVIATGNNNSALHFEYYFSKYPHIIRKNRNSVAILNGSEKQEELISLGSDIFTYFGLGCRNVSKIFVPEKYEFKDFFQAMFEYRDVAQHKKYFNNYEYHRALFLLEKIDFLDNNFMILRNSEQFSSPVSVLNYEHYSNIDDLKLNIKSNKEKIQCMVGNVDLENIVPFGNSQQPNLFDFADGVNTLEFLKDLG
ncbi:MAG: acyl-CoA reductase [Bacteroidota bacterium]|jgi:hypothetical protein